MLNPGNEHTGSPGMASFAAAKRQVKWSNRIQRFFELTGLDTSSPSSFFLSILVRGSRGRGRFGISVERWREPFARRSRETRMYCQREIPGIVVCMYREVGREARV